MTETPKWLETDWILAAFAEGRPEAQSAYRQFVANGKKNQPCPWDELKNPLYLGSEAFVEEMQGKQEGNPHFTRMLHRGV